MAKLYRFTASWCKPCQQLALELQKANLGAEIEVVDVDVFPELAQEYCIRSVPTLVKKKTRESLTGLKTAKEIQDWYNS